MKRYWILRNSAVYRSDNRDYVAGTKKEAEKLAASLNTAGARVWVEEVNA